MSNRPGLGADLMHDLASVGLQYDQVENNGDVVTALRHGGKLMPLGRYLVRRLRKLSGMPENVPAITLAKMAAEVHDLHQAALDVTAGLKIKGLYESNFRHKLIEKNKGKIIQLEARDRLFKKKGTL